jgi:hypothetical protein
VAATEGDDRDLGPMMCFARTDLYFCFCTLHMQACDLNEFGISAALSEI